MPQPTFRRLSERAAGCAGLRRLTVFQRMKKRRTETEHDEKTCFSRKKL